MRVPVNQPYTITTQFGVPDSNALFGRHSGIDYAVPLDRAVYAPASGKLNNISSKTGGNMVVIFDGKYYHRLMHNSSFSRIDGQNVNEGDEVARAGTTGLSTGVHCHWDVNTQGTYASSFSAFVDPNILLKQGGDMPSTVGDVEIDQMSWAYFGYGSPSNSDFTKEHRGEEANTFERFMFNHPVAVEYRKQVAQWKEAAQASKYEPVDFPVFKEKK